VIRWAVHRPAVVWATALIVLLGGAVSFTRLALATKTTVELPTLQVSAGWSGASAELVEMYISSPIEAAVQGVRGVRSTSSESTDGSASIRVTLEPDADVQVARLAIQERLSLLKPGFDSIGIRPPTVGNYVPDALQEAPLVRLRMTGPYTSVALRKIFADEVSPRLSAIEGTVLPDLSSSAQAQVAVRYDALLLRQLGISPLVLSQALQNARVVQALGDDQEGTTVREVTLRDQPNALEQLGDIPVTGRGGRVFRLSDLATIRPEEDTRGSFFRINGQPALDLTVYRQPGADAIKTAAAVRRALDELRPRLPPVVGIEVFSDNSTELKDQLSSLALRGVIAFAAVILVIAVMLRDRRAVALVMGSAAVSIAGTALGLYIFDIPANMLTLAGLAMGIGILVDNGLVVVERLGTVADTPESRAQAAKRIAPAVMGATLTTLVVLFPFLYLQGDTRAAYVPFADAFALGLGWSIVASLVMVPALASGHHISEGRWPRFRRFYSRLLGATVRHRIVTLTVTVIALGGLAWVFVKKVPRYAYYPYLGEQRTEIYVGLGFPRGSDPESLDNSMRELEDVALGQPGVEQVVAFGNGTASRMTITFTRESEFTAIPLEMEERLTQRGVLIGGANISVRGQGPGFSSGYGSVSMASFRIQVLGYSYDGVERLAEDMKERLERIPRVRNVDINTSSFFGREKSYAVTITPDREALARYGLTARSLQQAVAREIAGSVGFINLEIAGEEVPVQVKARGAEERTLRELQQALIPTPTGAPVKIQDVSTVSEQEALSQISRQDQQYVRIVAYEFRGPNKLAQRTHDAFMASITTPPGYAVKDAGYGFRNPDDSEKGLWLVFAVGVTLVLLTVALVFDSVWAAMIVFLSLPVALGGVILAFWVTKAAFTGQAAVGVILVVGLAVNQSILVVDSALPRRRANQARGIRGLGPRQARRAGLDRVGMVLLATMTSLASLLPLAIGVKTSTLFGSIALATAGGTLAGTFGALFVVPAMITGRRRRPPSGGTPALAMDVAPVATGD
jgi:HAE1 family hydrophobic/amphiphilic exporter-1